MGGYPETDKWGARGPHWLNCGWTISTFMAYENCPVYPPASGPQTGPGWIWDTGGRGQASVRHTVSGPHSKCLWSSLRSVPEVLESRGVGDTHNEQQQQIQGHHDHEPMAGQPGELAWGPAQREKECWQLGKNIFVLSVCKKFWLREHDMMNFILCEPWSKASCGSAREIWGCLPWHRQLAFQQNIF